MKKTQKFRELINGDEIILMPGAYDGLSARMIEEVGFKAMLASGAGISNSRLGWADAGLLTMTEMAEAIAQMADVTTIPILADGDTGYGNAINMIRTTKEFERAGAAGIQIEDQVNPKKCGHFEGKGVISKQEMIGKIKACVDTRQDPDFILLTRTDARAVNGLDDAIDRAYSYYEAGADITFIEAPQSIDEIYRYAKALKGIPLTINLVEGGKTPILSEQEAKELGFKLIICANTALRGAMRGMNNALKKLYHDRSQKNLGDLIYSWEERQQIVQLQKIYEWEDKYLKEIK